MASTAMEDNAAKVESVAEIKRLREELEALKKDFGARLAALEAAMPKAEETVPAEVLALISVAVTTFLGKKVKIRSARPLKTTNTWGQAGRAGIMASHNPRR